VGSPLRCAILANLSRRYVENVLVSAHAASNGADDTKSGVEVQSGLGGT
jgi:hypothetical protein